MARARHLLALAAFALALVCAVLAAGVRASSLGRHGPSGGRLTIADADIALDHCTEWSGGACAEWRERGIVHVQRAGRGASLSVVSASLEQRPLGAPLLARIASALPHDRYAVRIRPEHPAATEYELSTAPLCLLSASALRDTIHVHLDASGGAHVSLSPAASECGPGRDLGDANDSFRSQLLVTTPTTLPLAAVPTPVPVVRKADAEDNEEDKEEDNRSFIEKYWMYLVMGTVYIVVMNIVQSFAGGQQQQRSSS